MLGVWAPGKCPPISNHWALKDEMINKTFCFIHLSQIHWCNSNTGCHPLPFISASLIPREMCSSPEYYLHSLGRKREREILSRGQVFAEVAFLEAGVQAMASPAAHTLIHLLSISKLLFFFKNKQRW